MALSNVVVVVAFVLHVVLILACYLTGYVWFGWMASFCGLAAFVTFFLFLGKKKVEVFAKDE